MSKRKNKLLREAKKLELIAVDIEELSPFGKHQADKVRKVARQLNRLAESMDQGTNVHGGGTGQE